MSVGVCLPMYGRAQGSQKGELEFPGDCEPAELDARN